MKTKFIHRAARHSISGTVCAGAILLLPAAMNAQAQYNYITLSVPGAVDTYANGISGNNIVGFYDTGTGTTDQGFLYDGSAYTTLSVPGAEDTEAFGISGNDIVGAYSDGGTTWQGFLYDGSSYTTLSMPQAVLSGTKAVGISGNNIVGIYSTGGAELGFLYNINSQSYTAFNFEASGISGNIIVGGNILYNIDSQTRATLSVPGAAYPSLSGISGNNIVGYYYTGSTYQSFLYDGSGYTILGVPGEENTLAIGIDGNNIVGWYNNGSTEQGFLAIPVPEPSALGLLALGLTVFLLHCRPSARLQRCQERDRRCPHQRRPG